MLSFCLQQSTRNPGLRPWPAPYLLYARKGKAKGARNHHRLWRFPALYVRLLTNLILRLCWVCFCLPTVWVLLCFWGVLEQQIVNLLLFVFV